MRSTTTEVYDGIESIECQVVIHRGRDLAPKDMSLVHKPRSDPYIQVWANLPSHQIGMTTTKYKTLEPVYDEAFTYVWKKTNVMRCLTASNTAKLTFKIFDKDQFSSDDAMGDVVVSLPMPDANKVAEYEMENYWVDVDLDSAEGARGQLQISMNVKFQFEETEMTSKSLSRTPSSKALTKTHSSKKLTKSHSSKTLTRAHSSKKLTKSHSSKDLSETHSSKDRSGTPSRDLSKARRVDRRRSLDGSCPNQLSKSHSSKKLSQTHSEHRSETPSKELSKAQRIDRQRSLGGSCPNRLLHIDGGGGHPAQPAGHSSEELPKIPCPTDLFRSEHLSKTHSSRKLRKSHSSKKLATIPSSSDLSETQSSKHRSETPSKELSKTHSSKESKGSTISSSSRGLSKSSSSRGLSKSSSSRGLSKSSSSRGLSNSSSSRGLSNSSSSRGLSNSSSSRGLSNSSSSRGLSKSHLKSDLLKSAKSGSSRKLRE